MTDDAVRDLAAIRRGVEGRDVVRGPSATDLHDRAIAEAIRRAGMTDHDAEVWGERLYAGTYEERSVPGLVDFEATP